MKDSRITRIRKLLSLPLAFFGIVLFVAASFITPGLASISSPMSMESEPRLASAEARYEYDNSTVEGRLLNLQRWIKALRSYYPADGQEASAARWAFDLPVSTGLSLNTKEADSKLLGDFDADGRWIDKRKAQVESAHPYMTQPALTAEQQEAILSTLNEEWFRKKIAAAIRADANLGAGIANEIDERATGFEINIHTTTGFGHLKNLLEIVVKPENIDILEAIYEGTGDDAKSVSSLFDLPADATNGNRINPLDLFEALATGNKDYFLKRTKAELEVIKGIVPVSGTEKGTLFEKVALVVGKSLQALQTKAEGATGDKWNVGWYVSHVIPREAIKNAAAGSALAPIKAALSFGTGDEAVAYTDADYDDLQSLYTTSETAPDAEEEGTRVALAPGFVHDLEGEDAAKSVADLYGFFEDSSWKVLNHIESKVSDTTTPLAKTVALALQVAFAELTKDSTGFFNLARTKDTIKALLADEWTAQSDKEGVANALAPFDINNDLFDNTNGTLRTTARSAVEGEEAADIATPYKTDNATSVPAAAIDSSWHTAVFGTAAKEGTSDFNVFNAASKFLKGDNAAERLENFRKLFLIGTKTLNDSLEADFRAAANRLELVLPYLELILTTSHATENTDNKDQLAAADNKFGANAATDYFANAGISTGANGGITSADGTLTEKTADNTIFDVLTGNTAPFKDLTIENLAAIAALALPNPKLKKGTQGATKTGRVEYLDKDAANAAATPDFAGAVAARTETAGPEQWHSDLFNLRNTEDHADKKAALLVALKELRSSYELRKAANVLLAANYDDAKDAIYLPLIELYIEYLEAPETPTDATGLTSIFEDNTASETPNSLVTAAEAGLFTDEAKVATTHSNYENHLLAAFLLQLTRAQLEVFTDSGDAPNGKNWASLKTASDANDANPFLKKAAAQNGSTPELGSNDSAIINKIKAQYTAAKAGYTPTKINKVFRSGLIRLFKLYPELLEAAGLNIEADYGIDLNWWQPDETTGDYSALAAEFTPTFTNEEETDVSAADYFTYGNNTIGQYLRLDAKKTAFSDVDTMKGFLEDASGPKKISDVLGYGSPTATKTNLYADEAEENLFADTEIRKWLPLIQTMIETIKGNEILKVQLFGDENLSEEDAAAQGFLPRSWLNEDWAHTKTTGETTTKTPWFKADGSIDTADGAKRAASTGADDTPFIGTPESTHPAFFDSIPLEFVRAWTAPAAATTGAKADADRALVQAVRNRMLANFRSSNILAKARAAYLRAAKNALELQPYLAALQKYAEAQKATAANQVSFTGDFAPLNALKASTNSTPFSAASVASAKLEENIAAAANPDFFLDPTSRPTLLGALDTVTEWNALAALNVKEIAKAVLANTSAKAKIDAIVAKFFGDEKAKVAFLAERFFLFDQLYKDTTMTTLRKQWAEKGILFTPADLYAANEANFENDYVDQDEFFHEESDTMKFKSDISAAPEESVWWKLFAMNYSADNAPTIPGTTVDAREKLFKGLLKGEAGSFNGAGEVLFGSETTNSETTSIFQLALNYAFNQFNAASQAKMKADINQLIKGFEMIFPQLRGLLFDATGTAPTEGTAQAKGIGIALKPTAATANANRVFEIEFVTQNDDTTPGKFGWLTVKRKGDTFKASGSAFWKLQTFAVRFGFEWDATNNKVKAALTDLDDVNWDQLEALSNLPNRLPLDQKHMDPILTQISAEAARAGNEAATGATNAAARTIWADTKFVKTDATNPLPASMREVTSESEHNRFTYETGTQQRVRGIEDPRNNEIGGWNIHRNDGYKTPITASDLALLIEYDSSQAYAATNTNAGVKLVGAYFDAIRSQLHGVSELSKSGFTTGAESIFKPGKASPDTTLATITGTDYTHNLDGIANGLARMRSDPAFREFIQDRFFADPSEFSINDAIETPTASGATAATNDPLVFADMDFTAPATEESENTAAQASATDSEEKTNYNAIVAATTAAATDKIDKFAGFGTLEVPEISYSAALGLKRALAFMAASKTEAPTGVTEATMNTLQAMEIFWETTAATMLKNGAWTPNKEAAAAASAKDASKAGAFLPNTADVPNDNARDFAAYALPRIYPAIDYETMALLSRQVNTAGNAAEWKTTGADKVSDNINFERIPSLQRMRDLSFRHSWTTKTAPGADDAQAGTKKFMNEIRDLIKMRSQMLADAIAEETEAVDEEGNSAAANSAVANSATSPLSRAAFDYQFQEAVYMSKQGQKIELMMRQIEAELARTETKAKIVRIQNGKQEDEGLLLSLGLDANRDFDETGAIKPSSLAALGNSIRNSNIETMRSVNSLIQNDDIFDPSVRAATESAFGTGGLSARNRILAIVFGSLGGLLILVIVAALIWKKNSKEKPSPKRV